jgi:iron complex outermembrane receptor protein
MSGLRSLLLRTTAAALIGCGTSAAMAQDAPPTVRTNAPEDATAPPSGRGDEDIVVTARRRVERLLDVPVAGTALNADAIERYATSDLESVSSLVPQVNIDTAASGNGAIISMRGIGSANNDASIEQEVTINIDGVPISRGRVLEQSMFDQNRIEVLKGPQALFFGKNSPAGVITIASADPGSDLGGYARAGYDIETKEYALEGAVSGPLSDTLGIRLAGRLSQMLGGYTRNTSTPITNPALLPTGLVTAGLTLPGLPRGDYPEIRDAAARLTVVFKPSSRFDANFKFLVSDHKDNGYSLNASIISCAFPGGPSSSDAQTAGRRLIDPNGACSPGRRSSAGTIPAEVAARYPTSNGGVPFGKTRTYLSSLTANLALTDQVTLTSVTGLYDYNERQWSNYDYTNFALASGSNDDRGTSWSQELRLVTAFEFPLNVTGGLFYQNENRKWNTVGMIGYRGPDAATGRWDSSSSYSTFGSETKSAFVEARWNIVPTLELAGGARYTVEKKSGDLGNTYVHQAYVAQFLTQGTRLRGSFSEDNWSPQATLSWHPVKDVMVYVAYKTGFKSGGFTAPSRYPANATVSNQQFRSETAKGGEVGVKFSVLDRRLTGDLTAYKFNYQGLQIPAYNTVLAAYFTTNAGRATSKGVEGNLRFKPIPALTFRGSFGYNEGVFTEFVGAQCFTGQTVAEGCVGTRQNLAGHKLPRAPKFVGNLGIDFDQEMGSGWKFSASADVKYSSSYSLQANDSPFTQQKSYQVLNASVRITKADWQFAVVGTNLTDSLYYVIGQDKPLGARGDAYGYLGKPRQILFQITRQF